MRVVEGAGEVVPEPGPEPSASARARQAALDAGIDLASITGSGPDGRIVERDVRAAISARSEGAAASRSEPAPAPGRTPAVAPVTAGAAGPAPVTDTDRAVEEPRSLPRMRRIIAERLTASWTTTPHFTVTVAVDVTRLIALRAELKAAGAGLTVTDFVLAATARALPSFPDVNARTDGIVVWPRRRVHLGVAVSVPGGLVVPVIRDADRLMITEIHDRIGALAAAARTGGLPVSDLTGSTFTVSNLGMHGVDEFTAIINPGEAAILAVASATPAVVAVGDGVAIRSIMRLTLSADHRIVDGELAARFLANVRQRLEDPARILG